MKDIQIELAKKEIHTNDEICGTIMVGYTGKYDGVVINAQILDSNELITYTSYNGKQISKNVSRLFVPKDAMSDGKIEFTCVIQFEPKQEHDVKFRASIIEQHKEIESDIIFGKFLA